MAARGRGIPVRAQGDFSETDQAAIQKTEAETTLTKVNALMGAVSVLGSRWWRRSFASSWAWTLRRSRTSCRGDPYDLNQASEALAAQAGEAV
jgi:hypothetical protein